MRVAKSVNDGVGVVIAGAAIPTGETSIGAELDHPVRNDRAGERVTVSPGTDQRIDVTREILLRGDLPRQKNKQTEDGESFHGKERIYNHKGTK